MCTSDDLYLATYAENTWPAVGMVNGRGYDGQQIDAICELHGHDLKHT